MTDTLETAIQHLSRLSAERQNEVAAMLMNIVEQERSNLCLSADQIAEVRRRVASPRIYASEKDVKEFFNARAE